MRTTTHFVAGHKLSLEQGQRFVAERPFLSASDRTATVTIYNCDTDEAVARIPDLPREEADALVLAFNGGTSGRGRTWR